MELMNQVHKSNIKRKREPYDFNEDFQEIEEAQGKYRPAAEFIEDDVIEDTIICMYCNESVIKMFMDDHRKVCNGLINERDKIGDEFKLRQQAQDD